MASKRKEHHMTSLFVPLSWHKNLKRVAQEQSATTGKKVSQADLIRSSLIKTIGKKELEMETADSVTN
jgi:hypothetical protein